MAELADAQLQALLLKGGQSASSAVAGFAAEVRENVNLRRAFTCVASFLAFPALLIRRPVRSLTASTAVGCYAHAGPSRAAGRIGSAVALALHGAVAPADGCLDAFAAQLAMHVAAFNPKYVRVADIPPAVAAGERTSFEAQAAATGKSDSVTDRMVDGWLKKWHAEVCLEQQPFLMDDSMSVGAAVAQLGKTLGGSLAVTHALRLAVGEGVDKRKVDFAAEVAAAAAG